MIEGVIGKPKPARQSDECYVLDLCSKLLGRPIIRQHTFSFLLGDLGKNGVARRLRVDGFREPLGLVIEYHERQHWQSVPHFDKPHKLTCSGVHRGEQRLKYDQRRLDVLPAHGITLLIIKSTQLVCDRRGRWKTDRLRDLAALETVLSAYAPERPLQGLEWLHS